MYSECFIRATEPEEVRLQTRYSIIMWRSEGDDVGLAKRPEEGCENCKLSKNTANCLECYGIERHLEKENDWEVDTPLLWLLLIFCMPLELR